MKVGSVLRHADADLPSRIALLRKLCAEVDAAAVRLGDKEARSIVRHWTPAFGDLRLEKEGAAWVAVVYHYTCPKCRLDFDERDMTADPAAGRIVCPKCGERVAAAGKQPATAKEAKP